jgi:uncharacterized low-complexity protein
MTLKTSKKSLSIAVGTALGVSLALSPMAFADSSNPFGATELSGGYMQLAGGHAGEGKCGEGKCGGDKADKAEGACGEGKCGGDKAESEGKCGGDKAESEGKCGGDKAESEGKCGGDK